jgi:excisionase family DNA binding protein
MSTENNSSEIPNPEILTVPEVATILRVPKSTIWTMCRDGRLPHVRLSKRSYRLRRRDVEGFLTGNTR